MAAILGDTKSFILFPLLPPNNQNSIFLLPKLKRQQDIFGGEWGLWMAVEFFIYILLHLHNYIIHVMLVMVLSCSCDVGLCRVVSCRAVYFVEICGEEIQLLCKW